MRTKRTVRITVETECTIVTTRRISPATARCPNRPQTLLPPADILDVGEREARTAIATLEACGRHDEALSVDGHDEAATPAMPETRSLPCNAKGEER